MATYKKSNVITENSKLETKQAPVVSSFQSLFGKYKSQLTTTGDIMEPIYVLWNTLQQ